MNNRGTIMSLQFIHAADLHIDSPLKGLTSKSTVVAQKLRTATRDAFAKLVDKAIEFNVAFVVIAGDIFDGEWDDTETGLWTNNQFKRLEEASIPVFVVYGNHDKKNNILDNIGLPKNVKVFSDRAPERILYPEDCQALGARETEERIALTGQSYKTWKCNENLAANYPNYEPERFNIGVLHTGLGGDSATDYAPTSVETLLGKGYDYWALGHQHKREVFLDDGARWIGYSGALQGRHINEAEPKGFYLVTVEDGKLACEPEFIRVDPFQWFRVEIDATGIEDEEELKALFYEKIEDAVDKADGRYVAARVVFSGRTALFSELHKCQEEDKFTDMFLYTLNSFQDKLWVEQFQLRNLAPPVPEHFWNNNAYREIKQAVDAATASVELGGKTPIDDLRKKLASCKSLIQGDGDAGINVDDPEQLKLWYRQALDIIANALS